MPSGPVANWCLALSYSLQGVVADKKGSHLSYIIPFIGFCTVTLYGLGMIFYNRRLPKQNLEAAAAIPYNGSEIKEDEIEKIESPSRA